MHDNGEEKTDILVLVDEEGNEHDFAMVDRFAVEMKEYAILVPVIYPLRLKKAKKPWLKLKMKMNGTA